MNKIYKIISYENSGLIISDEEPKDGDITLDGNDLFSPYEKGATPVVKFKKIIATISPYKIEGLPMLEFDNQEEDVEKLAHSVMINYLTNNNPERDFKRSTIGADDYKNWWIAGYKAAQKQYSESDMRNAINKGIDVWMDSETESGSFQIMESDYQDILKSLQKKQFPIAVELTEDLQIIKWYYNENMLKM